MEKSELYLGLDPETLNTIISSVLTVISIFTLVTIGYYLYHYLVEKKNKK